MSDMYLKTEKIDLDYHSHGNPKVMYSQNPFISRY